MGKLIAIEGLDGSGKETQTKLLCEYLKSKNIEFRYLSFPDYKSPSSTLVKMYLNAQLGDSLKDVNSYAASSFFSVDRYISFINDWKNSYIDGSIILSDRYTTSNAIYQMAKLKESNWQTFIEWLEDYEYNKLGLPKPNLVIYLDMPIEISQKLMTNRYNGDESKKDIHEYNIDFLINCKKTSLYCIKKLGWKVVKCAENNNIRKKEDINKDIIDIIEENF